MKTMILLSAFFVAVSAAAAGPTRTITNSGMSYPGPSPENLLVSMANIRWLAMIPEGRQACPRGIEKILQIKAEAKIAQAGYVDTSVVANVQCN